MGAILQTIFLYAFSWMKTLYHQTTAWCQHHSFKELLYTTFAILRTAVKYVSLLPIRRNEVTKQYFLITLQHKLVDVSEFNQQMALKAEVGDLSKTRNFTIPKKVTNVRVDFKDTKQIIVTVLGLKWLYIKAKHRIPNNKRVMRLCTFVS